MTKEEEEAQAAAVADDERIAGIVRRVLAESTAPGATAGDPEPKGSATGGGHDVPANQMQAAAGNLVTELVGAVTEAAVRAGRKEGAGTGLPPSAPAPAAPAKARSAVSKAFWGE